MVCVIPYKEGGVEKFFLKWWGYPSSANSWEPLANLSCPELLAEFRQKRARKKDRKVRTRLLCL